MSDAPQSSTIPEADKKLADQLMMIGMIVAGVYGLLALIFGGGFGIVFLLIYGAIAVGLWFLGVTKLRAGDLQPAKMAALGGGVVLAALGLITLTAGGFGALLGLIALATAGALIYAAMLISPGRKLF